jgi:hypothetical protein
MLGMHFRRTNPVPVQQNFTRQCIG